METFQAQTAILSLYAKIQYSLVSVVLKSDYSLTKYLCTETHSHTYCTQGCQVQWQQYSALPRGIELTHTHTVQGYMTQCTNNFRHALHQNAMSPLHSGRFAVRR